MNLCRWGVWLALAGCGNGAMSDDDPTPTCDRTCIESRWWIGESSSCTVVCMGGSYDECTHGDCRVVDARIYASGSVVTLAPLLHSAEASSFYLLGGAMTNSYTIDGSCSIQVDARPPQTFSCEGDVLTGSTASLAASSAAQTLALESAAASGAPGRFSY